MSSKARLRDYDGLTPVHEWINHFKLVAKANEQSWTDHKLENEKKEGSYKERQVTEICLHLTGSLQVWLETMGPGDKKDPDALLELLKKHILGPDYLDEWHQKATDLKRNDFKSQQEYMIHKVQALNYAMPSSESTEKIRLELFLKGLPQDIQYWIRAQKADDRNSIEKINGMAMGFEKALESQKQKEENINVVKSDKTRFAKEPIHEKKTVTVEKMFKLVEINGQQYLQVPQDAIPENVAKLENQPPPYHSSQNGGCYACKAPSHASPMDSSCPAHTQFMQDQQRLYGSTPPSHDHGTHEYGHQRNYSRNFNKPSRGRGRGRRGSYFGRKGGSGERSPPENQLQAQSHNLLLNPENINTVHHQEYRTVQMQVCAGCEKPGHGISQCWTVNPALKPRNYAKN